MKTWQETVTHREGENMGRIIGSNYPYEEHDSSCMTEPFRTECIKKRIKRIETIEKLFHEGKNILIYYDPVVSGKLIDVGMYDGRPYWEPTPAVLLEHWFGREWHFWNEIYSYEIIEK